MENKTTKKNITNLRNHPIVNILKTIFTIVGILFAILQGGTWIYDRYIYNEKTTKAIAEIEFEKTILEKITVGSREELVTSYLGPVNKTITVGKTNQKWLLWELKKMYIGITLNDQHNVQSLFIYSPLCEEYVGVPQMSFIMCKDVFPEVDGAYFPWDSYLGAQDAGYIEEYEGDRSTSYLQVYFGTNDYDLVTYIDKNEGYFDTIGKKILDPNIKQVREIINLRKGIKPNFILFNSLNTEYSSLTNAMDLYYQVINYRYLAE